MGSKQIRAPIWFIAHGGPPTLFDVNHPAHQHWLKVASDIKNAKLKGIIFVSAHWQAESGDFVDTSKRNSERSILLNTNTNNPLIYDFYNFPKHYYETKFESKNPPDLQEAVAKHLRQEEYHVQETDRGIDHGVWVPLRASGPIFNVPLIQVSLPIATKPEQDGIAALHLGRALRGLREQGYAIIGGGQPVHNLRDYMMARSAGAPRPSNYGKTFSAALTRALVNIPSEEREGEQGVDPARWIEAKSLFQRPDYAEAHPTSEHLLPALVALGAAGDTEPGSEEFRFDEGPLAWNMYRYG